MMDIPDIEDSLENGDFGDASKFPSVEERYFERFYTDPLTEIKQSGQQSVMVHSNRICLVCLAPNHPVVREDKDISKINFQVSERLNRLDNAVRGKSKKGGQAVDEGAILCWIECSDGERYPVRSYVRGKLIEVNERLSAEPNLVKNLSSGESYIAIVLPKLPEGLADLKARMISDSVQ